MATGLIALLDDITGLAKVAAASLDDVAAQASRAGVKAAGVVIDDAAVTPRYVVGFTADRELPIVGKIAKGSLKNKLLYLLPAALLLSVLAPWAITPLLMLGGAFLCYEGSEKVFEALSPDLAHGHEDAVRAPRQDPKAFEDAKVRGAIKTDFILSAEIMAITLASVPDATFLIQALVLAAVGVGITLMVYGGVALIVKADDVGVALAANRRPVTGLLSRPEAAAQAGNPPTTADRIVRPVSRVIGKALVLGMPIFLKVLGIVGTAAMVWVGGGIIMHGLEAYGFSTLGHAVHDAAVAAGGRIPSMSGAVEWAVTAGASGLFGLLVGAILIPVVQVGAPVVKAISRSLRPAARGREP